MHFGKNYILVTKSKIGTFVQYSLGIF